MANIPKQKRRKPATRILRGMTREQWAEYERGVRVEEYKIHRDFLARGLYRTKHQPKQDRPFCNPFMTARAVGTTATAIV